MGIHLVKPGGHAEALMMAAEEKSSSSEHPDQRADSMTNSSPSI